MRLVSLALKQPCSGYNFLDRRQYCESFRCADEFVETFCQDHDFTLNHKETEFVGNALILHLDLKSNYAIKHPESNQASYSAEVVLVSETNYR